jgi:hemin uptake protein HemP
MQTPSSRSDPQSMVPPQRLADPPRLKSRDLFRTGNPILIEHGGELYYLRMTRNDKLILTK